MSYALLMEGGEHAKAVLGAGGLDHFLHGERVRVTATGDSRDRGSSRGSPFEDAYN